MRKRILSLLLMAIVVLGLVQPPALAAEPPTTHPENTYYMAENRGDRTQEYGFHKEGRNITISFKHNSQEFAVKLTGGEYKKMSDDKTEFRFVSFYSSVEVFVNGNKTTDYSVEGNYLANFILYEKSFWSGSNYYENYTIVGEFSLSMKFRIGDGEYFNFKDHDPNGKLIMHKGDEPFPPLIKDGSYTGSGTAKAHTVFGNWNILTLPLIKVKVADDNFSLSFRANKIDYCVTSSRQKIESGGVSIYDTTEGGRRWEISVTNDGKVTGCIYYDQNQKLEFDITLVK